MLSKPKLALSENRSILPKKHPNSGSPENWFSPEVLGEVMLNGISFDFFVNWTSHNLAKEIWIKRIVERDVSSWPSINIPLLYNEINKVDGYDEVKRMIQFSRKMNLKLKYILFKEQQNWSDTDTVVQVEMGIDEFTTKANIVTIASLRTDIKQLSGGPFPIGSKGLTYSTSTLESALSRTDSLWPGDVDLLLLDEKEDYLAILEFKKHTLQSSIQNQKLQNYYPRPDGKKYNRLAILRDQIGENIPILVIYYPTYEGFHDYKIEEISGPIGNLKTRRFLIAKLPQSKSEYSQVVKTVKQFL